MFFLFQDGVVHDVLDLMGNSTDAQNTGARALSSTTLAFARNVRIVDVKLSSPMPNIILMLVGSVILLLLTLAIGIWEKAKEAQIARFADAHNVAELLIDDTKYPSLLLKKMVDLGSSKSSSDDGSEEALDGFRIETVVLRHADGRQFEFSLPRSTSVV